MLWKSHFIHHWLLLVEIRAMLHSLHLVSYQMQSGFWSELMRDVPSQSNATSKVSPSPPNRLRFSCESFGIFLIHVLIISETQQEEARRCRWCGHFNYESRQAACLWSQTFRNIWQVSDLHRKTILIGFPIKTNLPNRTRHEQIFSGRPGPVNKWNYYQTSAFSDRSNCEWRKHSGLSQLLSGTRNRCVISVRMNFSVNVCARVLWLFISPWTTESRTIFAVFQVKTLLSHNIDRLSCGFSVDVQDASFPFAPQSALALITHHSSASSSSLGISINICIGTRTERSCSMTTKLWRFCGKFLRVWDDGLKLRSIKSPMCKFSLMKTA